MQSQAVRENTQFRGKHSYPGGPHHLGVIHLDPFPLTTTPPMLPARRATYYFTHTLSLLPPRKGCWRRKRLNGWFGDQEWFDGDEVISMQIETLCSCQGTKLGSKINWKLRICRVPRLIIV